MLWECHLILHLFLIHHTVVPHSWAISAQIIEISLGLPHCLQGFHWLIMALVFTLIKNLRSISPFDVFWSILLLWNFGSFIEWGESFINFLNFFNCLYFFSQFTVHVFLQELPALVILGGFLLITTWELRFVLEFKHIFNSFPHLLPIMGVFLFSFGGCLLTFLWLGSFSLGWSLIPVIPLWRFLDSCDHFCLWGCDLGFNIFGFWDLYLLSDWILLPSVEGFLGRAMAETWFPEYIKTGLLAADLLLLLHVLDYCLICPICWWIIRSSMLVPNILPGWHSW